MSAKDLLAINVNVHAEKKNGLTYLSWAWAWAEVLNIDPGARWHATVYGDERGNAQPCMFLPDGSAMVKTEVTILGETKACLLPVMDHRNKAIKAPDAFAINTAIMRCMTKTIGMHGLGLYIYAGEDLPQSGNDPEPEPKTKEPPTKIVHGAADSVLKDNPPIHPNREAELRMLSDTVASDFAAYGAQAAYERIEEHGLDYVEKIYLSTLLGSSVSNKIKSYSVALRQQPKVSA